MLQINCFLFIVIFGRFTIFCMVFIGRTKCEYFTMKKDKVRYNIDRTWVSPPVHIGSQQPGDKKLTHKNYIF